MKLPSWCRKRYLMSQVLESKERQFDDNDCLAGTDCSFNYAYVFGLDGEARWK